MADVIWEWTFGCAILIKNRKQQCFILLTCTIKNNLRSFKDYGNMAHLINCPCVQFHSEFLWLVSILLWGLTVQIGTKNVCSRLLLPPFKLNLFQVTSLIKLLVRHWHTVLSISAQNYASFNGVNYKASYIIPWKVRFFFRAFQNNFGIITFHVHTVVSSSNCWSRSSTAFWF